MMQCNKMLLFLMACSISYGVHPASNNDDEAYKKFIKEHNIEFIDDSFMYERSDLMSWDRGVIFERFDGEMSTFIDNEDASSIKDALLKLVDSSLDKKEITTRIIKRIDLSAGLVFLAGERVQGLSEQTFLQNFVETASRDNEKRLKEVQANKQILRALEMIYDAGTKPSFEDMKIAAEDGATHGSLRPLALMYTYADQKNIDRLKEWASSNFRMVHMHPECLKKIVSSEFSAKD